MNKMNKTNLEFDQETPMVDGDEMWILLKQKWLMLLRKRSSFRCCSKVAVAANN